MIKVSDYNHILTRVACFPVFYLFFAAGTIGGGLLGLGLGIVNYETVGLLGGAFIGLFIGLFLGLSALVLAVIFNLLAPCLGGIPVSLAPLPSKQEQSGQAHTDDI